LPGSRIKSPAQVTWGKWDQVIFQLSFWKAWKLLLNPFLSSLFFWKSAFQYYCPKRHRICSLWVTGSVWIDLAVITSCVTKWMMSQCNRGHVWPKQSETDLCQVTMDIFGETTFDTSILKKVRSLNVQHRQSDSRSASCYSDQSKHRRFTRYCISWKRLWQRFRHIVRTSKYPILCRNERKDVGLWTVKPVSFTQVAESYMGSHANGINKLRKQLHISVSCQRQR